MSASSQRISIETRAKIQTCLSKYTSIFQQMGILSSDLDHFGQIEFPLSDSEDAVKSAEWALPFYSHTKDSFLTFSRPGALLWSEQRQVDNRIFCNLYPCKISLPSAALVGDETPEECQPHCSWASTEHYFQCGKYALPHRNLMRHLSTNDVAKYGQSRIKLTRAHVALAHSLRDQRGLEIPGAEVVRVGGHVKPEKRVADWERKRVVVMYRALMAKFEQHKALGAQLGRTQKAWLIEHPPKDAHWGDGGDGKGWNMLGKLLMLVRWQIGEGKQKADALEAEYWKDLAAWEEKLCTDPLWIEFLEEPMENLLAYW